MPGPYNDQVFPFGPNQGSSQPLSFPYDVVINKAFPGVQYQPTEPGGIYAVTREVNGCLWFVNNADWNPNTLQWTQEDPTNAALPAYALELCANGTFTRYAAVATVIPGNPVVWQARFLIDDSGSVISTPQVVTVANDRSNVISVTWNAGNATQAKVREAFVTDTSSSTNSVFDQLTVNGVAKWLIDKAGILQVGEIPFARITGAPAPPSFNNVTLTGTTTLAGPTNSNGIANTGNITSTGTVAASGNISGANVTTPGNVSAVNVNASGSGTFNGLTTTTFNATVSATAGSYFESTGARMSDSPTRTTTPTVIPASNGSVVVDVQPCSFLVVGSTVLVAGSSNNVYGSFRGFITATAGSPVTQITVSNIRNIEGNPTDIIAPQSGVSYTTHNIYQSGNGTIQFGNVGTIQAPNLDLQSDIVPIGGTLLMDIRLDQPQGTAGYTHTFPTPLPARANGTATIWSMYATCGADLAGGAVETLTGGGSGVGWESAQTSGNQTDGIDLVDLRGTATSGQTPSCTYQVTGGYGTTGPTPGRLMVFRLTATRLS